MRTSVFAFAVCVAACASEPAAQHDPYLEDAAFRRATLVASLVNPDNGYSRLRLAHYESGGDGDWARLREWNPRVAVVAPAELDAPHGVDPGAPLGADARALDLSDVRDEAALVALGEQAFFRYPMQLEMTAPHAASSRDAFARYGFWTDPSRGTPLVRVELDDGSRMLAFTCATCHVGSGMKIGAPNDALDLGRLAFDVGADPVTLGWGPGRVDVTTSRGIEPVRIADLRPVRWLGWLQADGTVARRDRASLAIRIETLIVTSHHENVRPPRVVALALAAYVESLADSLPSAPAPPDVFVQSCAGCHAPPSYSGAPVALDVVGTDTVIGLSADRGTGKYRVPSLHGVATRGALMHDESVRDLDALLDPARAASGAHTFGLALSDADRAALRGFLGGL
ncbi:MAG TPA: hypothetical protein VIF62_13530 [Labilithrix sp.]